MVNLVQKPTGPTIYPSIKLPPVQVITKTNPPAPVRPGSAPMIPADKGPSNMGQPLRPGYPVK